MAWWAWILLVLAVLVAAGIGLAARWARREWHAIPPEERAPWPGYRTLAAAVVRETRRDWVEQGIVRRRMQEKSQRAHQDLWQQSYDEAREELRREGRLP